MEASDFEAHKQAHRNARKPGTVAKGYGYEHRKLRAQWVKRLERGPVPCAICGEPVTSHDDWELHHSQDRTRHLGPAHGACNRAAVKRNIQA